MKKYWKLPLFIVLFVALTAMGSHRFYTAIFQINFVPQKKTIQITTRIFIDDFNDALKNQYAKKTYLGSDKETEEDIILMRKYISEKFILSVNGKPQPIVYLSNEVEDNVLICYLKVNDVPKLNSLTIENSILTEMHSEQQNIIQFNDDGKKSNLLLSGEITKGTLK